MARAEAAAFESRLRASFFFASLPVTRPIVLRNSVRRVYVRNPISAVFGILSKAGISLPSLYVLLVFIGDHEMRLRLLLLLLPAVDGDLNMPRSNPPPPPGFFQMLRLWPMEGVNGVITFRCC